MNKRKILITVTIFSTLCLVLTFFQISKKDNVFANSFTFESLAKYVESYKPITSKKTADLIDESKYIEQYYFKKHLVSANLTDDEAKEEAFNQILEETALFEVAKKENELATKEDALKMSNEVREIFKNETEENKEVIQNVKDVIKGSNMTEDQYFNEFLVNEYIIIISIENLFGKITKDYEEEVKYTVWEEFKQKEVDKFVNKNQEYINEFKLKYSIK